MLSLFSIDAKQVEPLLIMAVCAIAGYFMWNHLKASNASNASAQPSAVDQQGADMNSYMQQVEQMSLLQALLGTGSSSSSTAQTAQTASSATTTQSSIPIVAPTPAAPSATASTTSVGSSNPGSV
jgi:flagellar basal body-associated protein FliL